MDRTSRFDEKNYVFNQESQNGIYLIHGFTNTTYEVKKIAQYLSEKGYHTVANNLPGHGTTIEECNRVKYHDWLSAIEQDLAELASKCKKIHIIGSSMGGVLGLYLATKFPINSLVVAAPVFKFKSEFKTRILVPLLNKLIPKREKSSQYSNGKSMKFYGYSYYPNKALNEFRKLTTIIRKKLINIKCPILMIYSESDLTCIMENYHIVNDNISSKVKEELILKKISHNMFVDDKYPNELNQIYKTIENFIGKF